MRKNLTLKCDRVPKKLQIENEENGCFQNYAKIIDGLYVGNYVCAQSRDFLRREGITHVVNCSPATCPNLFEDEFFYQNIDITDEASTDILVVMCLFVEAADKILAEGGKIYVHCYQGISRAPSMILGFLIWREGTTLESALGSLREKYQKADPNLGFLLQLEYFAGRTRLSPATPDYKIPFFEPKMEMVSSSN